jgi:hypothetical protein
MKVFNLLKASALGVLLGAQGQVHAALDRLIHADALASVLGILEDRLQDSVAAGKLSPCDAGEAAPDLLRVLSSFAKEAKRQSDWVARRFRSPGLLKMLWRPDPLDLALAMRGFARAAEVASGECWAIERTLRRKQYPLHPVNKAKLPTQPEQSPWLAAARVPWIPPDEVAQATEADIVWAVLWLDQRVMSTTQRNKQSIQAELKHAAGWMVADPLAVATAVAELETLAAFTLWFAQGVEQLAMHRLSRASCTSSRPCPSPPNQGLSKDEPLPFPPQRAS